jgi:hypothetical protein
MTAAPGPPFPALKTHTLLYGDTALITYTDILVDEIAI